MNSPPLAASGRAPRAPKSASAEKAAAAAEKSAEKINALKATAIADVRARPPLFDDAGLSRARYYGCERICRAP